MAPHERFVGLQRFGSLDGLRCLAILLVLVLHSPVGLAGAFANQRQIGVHLFFVISGFLITSLMIRERARTGTISMPGFYLRRTLRIFPLYYGVLAVYVVAVAVLDQGEDGAEFFANLPYFLTYTSNWFVHDDGGRVIFLFAWSLATEEQFYLTWPWLERYLGERVKIAALVGVFALTASVRFGLLPIARDSLGYSVLWSVAPTILLGVGLAHLLHSRRGFELAWRVVGHRAAAPLMLATVVAVASLQSNAAVDYLCYATLALLVAACVIREDNGLAAVLRQWPLVRIGVVSYGIYLMHQLVFFAVESVVHDPWSVLIIATLTVWGIAEISFATFERFFLRMKHSSAAAGAPAKSQPG